ncbi:MAG: acyltransferase [Gordonia sp. (in: high G+C Gram-positive bacteria)]|uniref:acyltransferase n=1 Tax=Gordonia sp. (in: high G+C Gram-positive bacteria) TaxID=84139 RepID=UPI0039E39D18
MDSSHKAQTVDTPPVENVADPAEFDPQLEAQDSGTAGTTGKAPVKKRKSNHLYQIDFVRLVTFAGVVLDHVILALTTQTEIIAQGVGLLLRYTRYCFFALTGFVQTYQYRNRELDVRQYWKRRYKYIGLPFVTWSLFYWVYNRVTDAGVHNFLKGSFGSVDAILTSIKSIAYDLITGHATYHLYFLSVSMQIYFVFPALLWLLKKTYGYHRYLLAVSGAFHIWLLYHMVRPPLDIFSHGLGGLLWRYLGITLLPYQFFILGGAIAALHLDAFTGFMKKWWKVLVPVSLITIALTLVYYRHLVHGGEEMFRATNVFMVHNMFAFLGIIVLLYLAGLWWQNRRTPGSLPDKILEMGADRSFAIYLAHVLAISVMVPVVTRWNMANGLRMFFMYLIVCALTVYLVEILRRSPISLITTGRERVDLGTQNPTKELAIAAASIVVGAGLVWRLVDYDRVGYFLIGAGILLVITALIVLRAKAKTPTAA